MAGENPNDQAAGLLELANKKVAESLKEIETLKNEKAVLEEEVEVLNAVNGELTLKIEEMSNSQSLIPAPAESKPAAGIPKETFEVDGQSYRFLTPVFVNDQIKLTAAEAMDNQELLEALVKKGSGLIVKA